MPRANRLHGLQFLALCAVLSFATTAVGAPPETGEKKESKAPTGKDSADREAALSQMLSGATLEGSYTHSGPDADGSKLAREKYTLGEVKKIAGDVWQFPARIQYGGKDITLPILLPIRWADDTPIVVVDNVTLPGFGAVSARVLFFDGHYAGYWKHGDHRGNLFGEIRPAGEKPAAEKESKDSKAAAAPSGGNSSAEKKPK